MITTVLVPTDFSDAAYKALHYGAALVRRLGADLHVVNVSETDFTAPGPAAPGIDALNPETIEARALKRQLERVIGPDIPTAFHGRTGRAFDQIVRCARELAADLIVMSTHGRTGLSRMFLGSNAERVVQHSSTPVLVVRRGERLVIDQKSPLEIKKVLVPVDFSASSAEGVNYALKFGRQFGASLVLFHSFEVPEFVTVDRIGVYNSPPTSEYARSAAQDQMREFVKSFDFGEAGFETQITVGRAAEEICDYAEKQGIDLIITSTHGRTGLLHVLIGSVAEHVVRYARSPVLVVPASVRQSGAARGAD